MKLAVIGFALLPALATFCSAEEPSLSLYQVIPGDADSPRGELIMKFNNPLGRTYYVWGGGLTTIEVKKGGKWISAPGQEMCLTSMSMLPVHSGSYLVFDTFLPKSAEDYDMFRVAMRIFAYSVTAPPRKPHHPEERTYIDLVSEPFSTKDRKPVRPPSAHPSSGRTETRLP